MKTYTIPIINENNIHSIHSNLSERIIKFKKECQYAVVLANYYGGKGYTTHKKDTKN